MAAAILPDVETLRNYFRYDPETGEIRYRPRLPDEFPSVRTWRAWSTRCVNNLATSKAGPGGKYLSVCLHSTNMLAHRVAYKMHFGEEPPPILDHINGDGSDNRIANLRPATDAQNRLNTGKMKRNRTGFKNVFYNRKGNRYFSQFVVGGQMRYVGCFKTAKEAHEAYEKVAREAHGEFFRPSHPQP